MPPSGAVKKTDLSDQMQVIQHRSQETRHTKSAFINSIEKIRDLIRGIRGGAQKERRARYQRQTNTDMQVFTSEPLPTPPDTTPAIFQLFQAYNLAPPRSGGEAGTSVKPANFQLLRDMSVIYDIARICIEKRKDQIKALDWKIVPSDKEDRTDYKDAIKSAIGFFEFPDRNNDFDDWISALLEDLLVIDAMAIYRRKDRTGRLYSAEYLDAATIKPLLDAQGRLPEPPKDAYQQWMYGYPNAGISSDNLIYARRHVRGHAVYGLSPLEFLVYIVNTYVMRERFDMDRYAEGNIPEMLVPVPENWTIKQIQDWQNYFDNYFQNAGDQARKRRAKFVPPSMLAGKMLKPESIDTTLMEWMAMITAVSFGLHPHEVIPTLASNRSLSEIIERRNEKFGIQPLVYFVEAKLNIILRYWLRKPNLSFKFAVKELMSPEEQSRIDERYVRTGIKGIDEVRLDMEMTPSGVPRFITTAQGLILLDDLKAFSEKSFEERAAMGFILSPQNITGLEQQTNQQKLPKTVETEKALIDMELKQWKTFMVNQVKNGGRDREFVAQYIPEETVSQIKGELGSKPDVATIRSVFDNL